MKASIIAKLIPLKERYSEIIVKANKALSEFIEIEQKELNSGAQVRSSPFMYHRQYESERVTLYTKIVLLEELLRECDLKPLSELINNEDDCKTIFRFFFPISEYKISTIEDNFISIQGWHESNIAASVFITFTGQVEIAHGRECDYPKNFFIVVDLIRSLGYEPVKD